MRDLEREIRHRMSLSRAKAEITKAIRHLPVDQQKAVICDLVADLDMLLESRRRGDA